MSPRLKLRRRSGCIRNLGFGPCERLEERRLLSSIVWNNRGSDGFELFGTKATCTTA